MLYQLVSLIGAALVLIAFARLQKGSLQREDLSFCLLNFFGSVLLTWVAVVDRRLGFIILEGSWALLSIWPILRRGRVRADH